jgi:hypothetical protein
MHDEGTLKIDPDFQRGIVWKDSDQTRFIDSLIKQMPIPSMCFSLDYKTQERQVVDGLQRMSSIIRFLDSKEDWTLSKLEDIDKDISGKKVSEIKKKHPKLFKIVQDTTIPVTILRCDLSKRAHSEYIFVIFHRLNTGGLRLNNQEIRNAIFQGPFNDLLKYCNENIDWKKIFTRKNISDRFKKMELILRFFAFSEFLNEYKGKLTPFLNDYMRSNRFIAESEVLIKKELFERVMDVIYKKIIDKENLNKIRSNAVLEAVWFGVANNLDKLEKQDKKEVKRLFHKLMDQEYFKEGSISEGLLKKEKVFQRLQLSKSIFAEK